MSGKAQCHSQSSSTGTYFICLRARRMTTAMYTMPATPTAPSASPAFETARHGTLRIADTSSAAQKWMTVGVPKAPTSGPIERASAPRTTTTNCKPVSAAAYEVVSTGTTGHAESVQITYDPSQVTYADLLRVFFSVAHDPTQLNRQGPDVGSQYRSAIFYTNVVQKEAAQAYIDQLTKARVFSGPIVTQVAPFEHFYPAEAYHQNYLARHPDQPYIVFNDLPKLKRLQEQFPALYKQ